MAEGKHRQTRVCRCHMSALIGDLSGSTRACPWLRSIAFDVLFARDPGALERLV